MRRSGKGSGGGLGMNKNVEKKVRTGKGGRAANPGYVAQLGQRVGNHITDRRGSSDYTGEIFHKDPAYNPVKYGNEVALNVGKGGPGTGRDFMKKAGSQGCYGPVNSGSPRSVPGKGDKDSLIDSFGPSYRGSGRG